MVVCWWHVGGVLPGGVAPGGLVARGVWWRCPCRCVLTGAAAPWCCWCVGGLVVWWLVVRVVLACGCLLCVAWGLHPSWFGVLVMWCVGAHECVFLKGLLPPLWVGGVGGSLVC